jgi:DNA polymerase-3 subunit epsilon
VITATRRLAHYCIVDVELRGLDVRKDEIISFAAVPVDQGRVVAGNTLHGMCKAIRPLQAGAVLVHGNRT